MAHKCPLCGSKVVYLGAIHLECNGFGCKNNPMPFVKQRLKRAIDAYSKVKFKKEVRSLSNIPARNIRYSFPTNHHKP